jgi:hypothetical protein
MRSTKQVRPRASAALATLLLALFSGCGVSHYVDGLETWHLRDTPLQPDDVLTAIAFGAETFVAVGYEAGWGPGVILTSPDGVNWRRSSSGVAAPLMGIAYGNGLFVAAGAGVLLTSPDAVNWTQRFVDSNFYFRSVSFFATDEATPLFMAVGMGPSEANPYYVGGVALVSPDGIAWTPRVLGDPGEMAEGVAFGQGTFVVVTHPLIDAEYLFYTSADTVQWTMGTWVAQKLLFGVLFARGRFVAVGGDIVDTACVILSSSDGTSWTPGTVSASGVLRAIAYGQNTLVAVGQGLAETPVPLILASTDGVRWAPKATHAGKALLGIAYGRDTFVAVGANGTILQSDQVSPPLW